MAELDKIPQKTNIEIETVSLDDSTKEKLAQLNQKQSLLITDFGQIYIRKKELIEELQKLDEVLEKSEADFKNVAADIKQILDDLDEKYPQMRISLQDGIIQYQPGAPTRKQLLEQQSRSV